MICELEKFSHQLDATGSALKLNIRVR